ncbi:MAG: FAD-dependent monooxygenase [Burkholderiaceae bacterium]
MTEPRHFDTDILIVGSGPMGATTALALATYGVRAQVVSRANWTADTPRAHITNQRAIEVLRDLGVEQEVRREATPWEWMGDTLFTTSLAGPEIARIRTWGTGDERIGDYLQASPCGLLDVPQNRMEPILVKNAAARGARFAFNTEYLGHVQEQDGVTVSLAERDSGREYTMRARYLVGADGARSKVLEDAGLEVQGHFARAGTVYTLFNADLSRYVAHRPSILYWIVSPNAAFGEIGLGLLRAIKPWHQWISGWGYDMSKGEPDMSPEEVTRRIRILVGDPDLKIDIDNTSTWYVNQAWAPVYSKGRVFCGGDAVHRHPPSSGLGSNTCMGDAFNLAWKLAFVVRGWAGAGLLDSYSLERAPVGQQVVMRANQSRLDYAPLNACFRDPDADNPVVAGLQKLTAPDAEGVARRTALADALMLKNTEFNAEGVELNQRCESGAVIPDPGAEPEQWRRDPQLYVQATTRPGAKMPHCWLVGRDGRRVSTLDVVGRGSFSLVTGVAGTAWVRAAAALDLPWLRTVVIGQDGAQDYYYHWHRLREIDEAGALLVRPDAVVAWRSMSAAADADDARRQLDTALSRILGREVTAPVAP